MKVFASSHIVVVELQQQNDFSLFYCKLNNFNVLKIL